MEENSETMASLATFHAGTSLLCVIDIPLCVVCIQIIWHSPIFSKQNMSPSLSMQHTVPCRARRAAEGGADIRLDSTFLQPDELVLAVHTFFFCSFRPTAGMYGTKADAGAWMLFCRTFFACCGRYEHYLVDVVDVLIPALYCGL